MIQVSCQDLKGMLGLTLARRGPGRILSEARRKVHSASGTSADSLVDQL